MRGEKREDFGYLIDSHYFSSLFSLSDTLWLSHWRIPCQRNPTFFSDVCGLSCRLLQLGVVLCQLQHGGHFELSHHLMTSSEWCDNNYNHAFCYLMIVFCYLSCCITKSLSIFAYGYRPKAELYKSLCFIFSVWLFVIILDFCNSPVTWACSSDGPTTK